MKTKCAPDTINCPLLGSGQDSCQFKSVHLLLFGRSRRHSKQAAQVGFYFGSSPQCGCAWSMNKAIRVFMFGSVLTLLWEAAVVMTTGVASAVAVGVAVGVASAVAVGVAVCNANHVQWTDALKLPCSWAPAVRGQHICRMWQNHGGFASHAAAAADWGSTGGMVQPTRPEGSGTAAPKYVS